MLLPLPSPHLQHNGAAGLSWWGTLETRARELTHLHHPRPKHLTPHIHWASGIVSLPHAHIPEMLCRLLIFEVGNLCFRRVLKLSPKVPNYVHLS